MLHLLSRGMRQFPLSNNHRAPTSSGGSTELVELRRGMVGRARTISSSHALLRSLEELLRGACSPVVRFFVRY
jgi:hypothetical protein